MCRTIIGSLTGDRRQERFGVVMPAVQSRVYLARALAERGSFGEANSQGREAIRLAEEFDHPFSRCWACLGLAYVKNVQGEWLRPAGCWSARAMNAGAGRSGCRLPWSRLFSGT